MKKILLLLGTVMALVSMEAKDKVVKYKNGDVYEGEWQKKAPNGYGVMTYANGDRYTGSWVDGMQSGEGTFTYSNGDEYIGQWIEGQKSGKGTLHYSNGARYNGDWFGDLRSGEGTYYSSDSKDTYSGGWKADKKDGKGTYIKGSVKYTGIWKEDELEDGIVTDGEYTFKGQCNKYFSPAKGKLTIKNKDFFFEGTFEGNSEHLSDAVIKTGKGFFPLEDGCFRGEVVNGQLSEGVYYERVYYDLVWMDGRWHSDDFDGQFLIVSRDNYVIKGERTEGDLKGTLHFFKLKSGSIHFFEGSVSGRHNITGKGYILPSENEKVSELSSKHINRKCSGAFKTAGRVQRDNLNEEGAEEFYTEAIKSFYAEKESFLQKNTDLVVVSLNNGANGSTAVSYTNDYLGTGTINTVSLTSLSDAATSISNVCNQIRKNFQDVERRDRDALYNSRLANVRFYKELHLTDISKDFSLVKGEGVKVKITTFFKSEGKAYFSIEGFPDEYNLPSNVRRDNITRRTISEMAKICTWYQDFYPYHVRGQIVYIEVKPVNKLIKYSKTESSIVLAYDAEAGTLRWDKYGIAFDKTTAR